MNRANIAGIGYSVPDRIVKNSELEKYMDTSDEWIQSRSGIKERRWVEPGTGTSDLAIDASKKAIQMADIDPKTIDLIIVGSLTSDYFFPGVSAQLQDQLNLRKVAAFDVKAACSGFVYSLSIGDQFIRSGMVNTALVVGAEAQTKLIDKTTKGRDIAVLFGDGAGAAVLQSSKDQNGILSTHLHCDGKEMKSLWMEAPGSSRNAWIDGPTIDKDRFRPIMNGREV